MAIQRGQQAHQIPQAAQQEDEGVENILRPQKLGDFIGQEQLTKNLQVMLSAAKKRKEPAPHLLFYGPPGLGKTTLATLVSKEMEANIKVSSGPALEKSGDLAAILSSLEEGDVLFLDEIHRLRRPVEEILYSAMEDFVLDIVVGKGPGAKTMRLSLPRFTLVAATTKFGSLSPPLRDRFGESLRLEPYSKELLQQMAMANAKILGIGLDREAAVHLSACSRGTPRILNRMLQRVRDFAHVDEREHIDVALAKEVMGQLGVDPHGLTKGDRDLLLLIAEKFAGGPVGLSTLAAAFGEDKETIEDIYEAYLLQLGYLERTPKGRQLTSAAYEHLGLLPKKGQGSQPLF